MSGEEYLEVVTCNERDLTEPTCSNPHVSITSCFRAHKLCRLCDNVLACELAFILNGLNECVFDKAARLQQRLVRDWNTTNSVSGVSSNK